MEIVARAKQRKCLECAGTGKTKCIVCKGRGRVGGVLGLWTIRCNICDGSGLAPCVGCAGAGTISQPHVGERSHPRDNTPSDDASAPPKTEGSMSVAATRSFDLLVEIDAAIEAIQRARSQGLAGAGKPLRPTGVQIMKFLAEQEQRFRMHSDLLTGLARKALLAKYRVCKLDLGGAGGFAGLIFVTGEADEMVKYARYAYYLRDAEEFVAQRCRNDWSQIDAAATDSDFPAIGCKLDLSGAERNLTALASLVRPRAEEIVDLTASVA